MFNVLNTKRGYRSRSFESNTNSPSSRSPRAGGQGEVPEAWENAHPAHIGLAVLLHSSLVEIFSKVRLVPVRGICGLLLFSSLRLFPVGSLQTSRREFIFSQKYKTRSYVVEDMSVDLWDSGKNSREAS